MISRFLPRSFALHVAGLIAAVALAAIARPRDAAAQEPPACLSPDPAQWPASSRPYFMLLLDTSGSMDTATTSGNPSCPGYPNTRMGHAKCALRNLVQTYGGQVNFGLAQYATFFAGCGAACPGTCQPFCFNAEMATTGNCVGCGPRTGNAATRRGANVLVPMQVDNTWGGVPNPSNVPSLLSYFDNVCTSNIEVQAVGNTPINGSLRDMQRYFSVGWTNPDNAAITYPSPLNSMDRPCRSVNVLLITDGDETCDTQADAVAAATALNAGVTVGGNTFRVRTFTINFAGGSQANTDAIAAAGGTTASYFATNETQLSIAMSTIVSSATRPETCDNTDNNCNGCTDEGFNHYCNVPRTGTACCMWATAAQRNTCLTTFRASITPANPSGNTTLLPCTTPAQQAQPASWLCFDPGDVCDNVDNNCNAGVDEGARRCGLPLHCPIMETCNGLDDDCDGLVDDGGVCGTCIVAPEICDGCDNDCDGIADNGIAPISCGLTTPANCTGTQTCAPRVVPRGTCVAGGGWSACSNTPAPETCDNLDNDCNGIIDDGIPAATCEIAPGLVYGGNSRCRRGTQTCGGMCMGAVGPGPEVCDGVDNDCDGMTDEDISGIGAPCCAFGALCGTGICTAGTLMCAGGTSSCVGGTGPVPETCNGADDDCNGTVDDMVPAGGSCGSAVGACHTGSYVCRAGNYVCEGATFGMPETCNGIDDDCNGVVDDGNPGGGAPCAMDSDGGVLCSAGTIRCRMGALVCEGGRIGAAEVCNCMDDNCDGAIDEDPNGTLCAGGGRCIDCSCRTPCRNTEFPCSIGFRCDQSEGGTGFCVPDLCGAVMCPVDQVCRDNRCVDPCDGVSCPMGQSCRGGSCFQNDCYLVGCAAGQLCRRGVCAADPCATVTCGDGQFCREGMCVRSCAGVACDSGQSCRDGVCTADPCASITCPSGQRCAAGTGLDAGTGCVADPCTNVGCGAGRICSAGGCIDDPCTGVVCPGTNIACAAINGVAQCGVAAPGTPGGGRDRGVVAGGGGFGCAVSRTGQGTNGSREWLGLFALVAAAVMFRSRRRRLAPVTSVKSGAAVALAALVGVSSGCRLEPYCFNCSNDGSVQPDTSTPDVRDVPAIPVDSPILCEGGGSTETCDGIDNNCNGTVDEGFDLQTDVRNCGACNRACQPSHAAGECRMGACTVAANGCDVGWLDLNGRPDDGCEYECTPSGAEVCDGRDNDCDGMTDEGFDTLSDPTNCGMCTNVCRFDNAVAACVNGTCGMAACAVGFLDLDSNPANGCEYACTPSGAEVCDGRDNDCNGTVDDGFNLMTDLANCGACGRACALPGATSACTIGRCTIAACMGGFRDRDGNPDNGCEWACGAADGTTSPEVCDGRDNNCDGTVDEGFDTQSDIANCGMCGMRCGPPGGNANYTCDMGTCRFRGCAPNFYDLNGDGVCEYACMFRSSAEACNGRDDNCNGMIDENVTPPSPTAVCGVAPGARTPECTTGVTVACTGGAWRCTFQAGVCSGGCAGATEVCDTLDNNCDGRVNENVPTYGQPCASDDGLPAPGDGACRTTGTLVCNGANAVRCSATRANCSTLAGGCTEVCDGIDNDCDGLVDETFANRGTNAANFVRPAVTHTAANVWIYSYEASRPRATNTMPGIGNGYYCAAGDTSALCSDATIPAAPAGTTLDRTAACSVPNRIPWFNVRPNEAQQTCRAMGGHLCTTVESQTACGATASCSWGYAPRGAACTSVATAAKYCNLGPYDFNTAAAGDQDGLLVGGSALLANCYADWSTLQGNTAATSRIYDITGNLREITVSGSNTYPLMGGSFVSPVESGATCSTTFYTVDQTYQYFDTGFRCCFSADPTL